MEPTKKSAGINDAISSLVGRDRIETITNNVCMVCGGPANEFSDDLSRKEYSISGLCQDCQDSVFGGVDDDYDDDYCDDYDDDDGQPDEYTEWQDYIGGDDWDYGQTDYDY